MGQCSTAQEQHFEQLFRNSSRSRIFLEDQLSQKFKEQENTVESVTYIENLNQIIFQFKDTSHKEHDQNQKILKLPVQKRDFGWNQKSRPKNGNLEITQVISESCFIAAVPDSSKQLGKYRVVNIFKVESLKSKAFRDFAFFYKQIYGLRPPNKQANNHNLKTQTRHVYPQQCFLIECPSFSNQEFSSKESHQICFAVQSQQLDPTYSLKNLGVFMKKNDITWQDTEFCQVIKLSLKALSSLHRLCRFGFEDFLVVYKPPAKQLIGSMKQHIEIKCLGGFITKQLQYERQRLQEQDHILLCLYYIEILYGEKIEISDKRELKDLIVQLDENSKFKHPQSLSLLFEILSSRQIFISESEDLASSNWSCHISHYIQSYQYKHRECRPFLIAEWYQILNNHQRAKEIYFELLSSLLNSDDSNMSTKMPIKTRRSFVGTRPLSQQISKNHQILKTFEEIIKILKYEFDNGKSVQSDEYLDAVEDYCLFVTKFSLKFYMEGKFLDSLNALDRANKILNIESKPWFLSIFLAEVNFALGDIEKSEHFFNESIKLELNQVTVCGSVRFYCSVLNWQRAIELIKSYETQINSESLYQYLIGKSLIAKSLCIPFDGTQGTRQRSKILTEAEALIARVLQKSPNNELFLTEVFEALGDIHFYMNRYEDAREAYQKSIVIYASAKINQKQAALENDNSTSKSFFSAVSHKSESRHKNSLLKNHSVQSSIHKASQSEEQNPSKSYESFYCQPYCKSGIGICRNPDYEAILLSSVANTFYLQKKYKESVEVYEKSLRKMVSNSRELRDSILGNMGLSILDLELNSKSVYDTSSFQHNRQNGANSQPSQTSEKKLESQGCKMLAHVLALIEKENPKKLQEDVNYIFLKQEYFSKRELISNIRTR